MTKYEKLMSCLSGDIDAAIITEDVNRRYFTGMKRGSDNAGGSLRADQLYI